MNNDGKVLFNEKCSICNFEIRHYKNKAEFLDHKYDLRQLCQSHRVLWCQNSLDLIAMPFWRSFC